MYLHNYVSILLLLYALLFRCPVYIVTQPLKIKLIFQLSLLFLKCLEWVLLLAYFIYKHNIPMHFILSVYTYVSIEYIFKYLIVIIFTKCNFFYSAKFFFIKKFITTFYLNMYITVYLFEWYHNTFTTLVATYILILHTTYTHVTIQLHIYVTSFLLFEE